MPTVASGAVKDTAQKQRNWWQSMLPDWVTSNIPAEPQDAWWHKPVRSLVQHFGLDDPAQLMTMGMGTAAEKPTGIKAYHGGPHDFDAFDFSKVGTGQGAATFGHGLYFAGAEPVSTGYRESLSRGIHPPDDVIARYFTPGSIVRGYGGYDKVLEFKPATSPGGRWEVRVQRVDPATGLADEFPRAHSTAPRPIDVQAAFAERGVEPWRPGRQYEVNLGVEPDQLLDWDRALTEQSPEMQRRLEQVFQGKTRFPPKTGEKAYRHAELSHGGKPEASEAMRQAGIPGLQYLDQFSRSDESLAERLGGLEDAQRNLLVWTDRIKKGTVRETPQVLEMLQTLRRAVTEAQAKVDAFSNPTRNYVIWDPKTPIDILRKYGLLPPIAGGLLAGQGDDQDVGTPPPVMAPRR